MLVTTYSKRGKYYDINGNFMGTFLESQRMSPGNNKMLIDLSGNPRDLYILAIKTKMGDFVTRIISVL